MCSNILIICNINRGWHWKYSLVNCFMTCVFIWIDNSAASRYYCYATHLLLLLLRNQEITSGCTSATWNQIRKNDGAYPLTY